MATFTTFLNMRKADNGDSANVLTDIDAAFTTLDSLFDPAALSAAQAPRVVMRETVHNPTYVGAANTIDLRPVWNAPGGTLRGLFIDATHTGAGASSRVIEVRRSGNPIWDVDITTQNAVNGLSLQGGAAGTPAVLRAIGTDTNVGITLSPKGTGSVVVGGTADFYAAPGKSLFMPNSSGQNNVQLTNIGGAGVAQLQIIAASGTSFSGPVTLSGDLTNLAAVSRTVPGATSWAVRNNANALDNLLVTDAGVATVRAGLAVTAGGATITAGDVTLTAGKVVFGAAASQLVPGATSFSLRNNANTADNFLVSDAGIITTRNHVGVGVAPNAGWDTNLRALQVGTYGALASNVSHASLPTWFATNTYADASNYRALNTGAAAKINLDTSGIRLSLAPSAVAGAALTFTDYLVLDSSGNLALGSGTLAASGRLRFGNSNNIAWRNGANTNDVVLSVDSSDRFNFAQTNTSTSAVGGGAVTLPGTCATTMVVVVNGTQYRIALFT